MSEQRYESPPSPEELRAQFLAAAREALKALAILRRSRAGLVPLPLEPSPELLKIEIALARAAGCLKLAAEALATATENRVETPASSRSPTTTARDYKTAARSAKDAHLRRDVLMLAARRGPVCIRGCSGLYPRHRT
jgi:hypothetical protein